MVLGLVTLSSINSVLRFLIKQKQKVNSILFIWSKIPIFLRGFNNKTYDTLYPRTIDFGRGETRKKVFNGEKGEKPEEEQQRRGSSFRMDRHATSVVHTEQTRVDVVDLPMEKQKESRKLLVPTKTQSYTWVFVPIKQLRYKVIINYIQSCWQAPPALCSSIVSCCNTCNVTSTYQVLAIENVISSKAW